MFRTLCELLKKQVIYLEYQLEGAREVDKFHAESERRAWKSKRFHEARAAKAKEESKELKDRLEAENRELKSQIREQNDADLMLLALQGAGLILSKGAVDKFEADELMKETSRMRMVSERDYLDIGPMVAGIERHGVFGAQSANAIRELHRCL